MKAFIAGALAVALAGAALPGAAQAQVVQAGTLTCEVAPGIGLVIGSRKAVSCSFQNSAAEIEVYDGQISKLGVDLGITDQQLIVWSVFAPSGRIVRGALAGSYLGATAEATVGVGAGANVLVGGFRRSITLQPLSISGQEGLNVAAGGASLTLRLRPEPRRR